MGCAVPHAPLLSISVASEVRIHAPRRQLPAGQPVHAKTKLLIRKYLCILHKTSLMNSSSIFKAIAHPARREILALLSTSTRTVKELTTRFSMSQSAVSQHLRELRDARLVASERIGTEQHYRLTAAPLKTVHEWSAQYQRFFDPAGHAWALLSSERKVETTKKGRRGHGD